MKINLAQRNMRGFTLIELMIVVAIIAILAAIAMPTYNRYIQRTRRSDAQQMLLQVAGAEERYYGTNNSYGSLTDIGFSSTPLPSAHGYYSIALSTASTSGFTATATPVTGGPQASDSCGALSISDTGAKTQTGTTSNGSCW